MTLFSFFITLILLLCMFMMMTRKRRVYSTQTNKNQNFINETPHVSSSKSKKKIKKKIKINNQICDEFYLRYRGYFDTSMRFEDNDIRIRFFPIIKKLFNNPTDRDAILDIGGNLGDITSMLNNYFPNVNIYTAEPLPIYIRHMNRRFNGKNNIHIYNLAIGNNRPDKAIKYDQWHHMMIVSRRLYEKETAHFMTLDNLYFNYVKNKSVLFLKVDVEGYEDEVLFSGNKLLKSGKVKLIYYEYHRSRGIWCRTKNSDLIHYLEGLGYSCFALGKYKIIRLTEKCLNKYDKHIYPHTIAIKDDSGIEDILISSYNSKYGIKRRNK